jgi:HK97 family phage major capsid protein
MTEEIKSQGLTSEDVSRLVQEGVTKAINALPGYDKLLNAAPEGKDHAEEKSFADYIIALQRHDTKRIEGVYKAALSEESGAVGGYLVPVEYSNQILRIAAERSVVRANGPTIINMTTREWNVPALSYTGSTAGKSPQLGGVYATWTAEAADKTETEPTFLNVKLVYNELSGYTLASAQVRMDAGPSLESMLRELFADAIAFHEDWAFINGNGAGEPLGVLKSDCLLCEVAASSTFVLSDIASMLEMFHSRRPNGGVWFMHPKVLSKLIALADGSGAANNVIWIPSARDNAPATLFGRPIVFTDRMPVLPAGTSAAQIGGVLLADWSYYLIGDRAGLQIDFSEHYKFVSNQGTWRFAKYVDGQPWMQAAMYLADGSNQVSPFVSLKGA